MSIGPIIITNPDDVTRALEQRRRKGECYYFALEQCAPLTRDKIVPDFDSVRLVHGRHTLKQPPFEKYGHAWLEWTQEGGLVDVVYDVCRLFIVPKFAYYRQGDISPIELFRYTVPEARAMALDYGHVGPWEGIEGIPTVKGGRIFKAGGATPHAHDVKSDERDWPAE